MKSVPGGTFGLWLVCGIGLLGAVIAIVLGFFPPEQLAKSGINPTTFITFLAVGLAIGVLIPLVITYARRLK